MPEIEREEVRQIYRAKGFEGELLEQVVSTITADKDRWVDIMMKEELEMISENKSALSMAFATFVSFVAVGFIPLIVYVWDYFFKLNIPLFWVSCVFTSLVFIGIGWLKSFVNQSSKFRSILETLLLGVIAALLAYGVGNFLEQIITKSR
jgi:vacuolar iron transporter family protein